MVAVEDVSGRDDTQQLMWLRGCVKVLDHLMLEHDQVWDGLNLQLTRNAHLKSELKLYREIQQEAQDNAIVKQAIWKAETFDLASIMVSLRLSTDEQREEQDCCELKRRSRHRPLGAQRKAPPACEDCERSLPDCLCPPCICPTPKKKSTFRRPHPRM